MGVLFSKCFNLELQTLKPKKRLEDLDDDCLMQVLERLSPADLMKMARVNKRLNRLVEVKLGVKIKMVVVERQLISTTYIHGSFDSDEIVYFNSMFSQEKMNTEERKTSKDFHSAPAKAKFLKNLARFASIKSIDFGFQEVTNEVLQEVAKLCPKVERIYVRKSVVDEDVWKDFFTQVGHQIVHFLWLISEGAINNLQQNSSLAGRILEMIVFKCHNIKQVEIYLKILTTDLIDLLKKLPKDCYVCVLTFLVNQPFGDTIDFLYCFNRLDWSCFKNSPNRRLTKLYFSVNINEEEPNFVVDFSNLKNLSWYTIRMQTRQEIDCLLASRYPKLESFEFTAIIDFLESDYQILFENMPQVKELNIQYLFAQVTNDFSVESPLPGDAVLQLKKLERMQVIVDIKTPNWQTTNFVQRLNWYVDEIPSLKSLVVEGNSGKMQMIAEELEQLKERQKRVDIVVMSK